MIKRRQYPKSHLWYVLGIVWAYQTVDTAIVKAEIHHLLNIPNHSDKIEYALTKVLEDDY